jgi:hypothetical protein
MVIGWRAQEQQTPERNASVDTAVFWTGGLLTDVVAALRTSLGRVSADEMSGTPAAEHWNRVQDWLRLAEQTMSRPATEQHLERLAAFPLTGPQLRALQTIVDEIVQARSVVQLARRPARADRIYQRSLAAPLATSRTRLQDTFRRLHLSSHFLALVLLASLTADLIDLVFLQDSARRLIIGVNFLLTSLAVAIWMVLHAHLNAHRWSLGWHLGWHRYHAHPPR